VPATSYWSRSHLQGSVGAPMTMLRGARLLFTTLAAGTLATASLVGLTVSSAGAVSRAGVCTLLPVLCPPTTPPKTAPPTTKAPVVTAPPSTAHVPPTVAATAAAKATTKATATALHGSAQPAVASVGAGVLPPAVAAPADLGAGSDAAAPQLAPASALAAGNTTATTTSSSFSGLVGATQNPLTGLPSKHSRLRLVLSLFVFLIAAIAAAQIPESRRSPRPALPPT
jgi:hypothetical protein